MARRFGIKFVASGAGVVAELLEDPAPITCGTFWTSIAEPHTEELHHGRETGPELWCFVPPPAEDIPYENSTVFPEHGDVLYYHYRQPPTRDGAMVYDVGIYWDRGQSKLAQGWVPGNLFARVHGPEQIETLRVEAGRLLTGGRTRVTLARLE
jgi:hypothetical protein